MLYFGLDMLTIHWKDDHYNSLIKLNRKGLSVPYES
jgi:hypothetical protein